MKRCSDGSRLGLWQQREKIKGYQVNADINHTVTDLMLNAGKNSNYFTYVLQALQADRLYLPVAWVVNSGGDAMGVVCSETEAVILLKVLIGSHTEIGGRGGEGDSHVISYL